METETCTTCNIEKHTNKFYKKCTECKACDRKRGLKHYYENKDKYQFDKKNIMKEREMEY